MGFTLDSALSHVSIDESLLYEVYRSVEKQVPVDPAISRRECEAFICTAQEGGVVRLYVAFWEINTRRNIVLVPSAKPKGMKEYPGLLADARQFLADQGFHLEQVKLDFSVAMRQTIMKTIRVLHPPAKAPASNRYTVAKSAAVNVSPQPSLDAPPLEAASLSTKVAASSVPHLVAVAAPAAVVAAAGVAITTAEQAALSLTVERLQARLIEVEQGAAARAAELEQELEAERHQRREAEALVGELDALRNGLAAREAELESLAHSSTELRKEAHERHKAQTALAAQVASLQQELAESRGAAGETTEQPVLPAAIERLQATLAEVEERAASRALELERDLEVERHQRQEAEGQLSELAALQQELDASQGAVEQLTKENRASAETLQRATEEKMVLERELAVERQRRQEAEQQGDGLVLLHQDLAQREDELAEVRQELSEAHAQVTRLDAELNVTIAARQELEGQLAHRDEELHKIRAQLAKDQQAVKKLGRELAESRSAADQARSASDEELASLRDTKETLEQAIVELLAVARAEQEALARELVVLQQELARQRGAGEALVAESQQRQAEAQTEIARLREDLRVQEDAANREQAALRAEIRRVIAERVPAGVPLSAEPAPEMVALQTVQVEAEDPYRSPTALEYAALLEAGDSGPALPFAEFGESDTYTVFVRDEILPVSGWDSIGGGSGTQFSPDRTLTVVPCPSAEALVALYESVNKVQSAPDGREPQKCRGYVCVVKSNDMDEVYLAWFMEESRRVQVCRPCRPVPEGVALEQVVKDAVFYFESAGLMMEPVELAAPKKRDRQLKRIPVFSPDMLRGADVATTVAGTRLEGAL